MFTEYCYSVVVSPVCCLCVVVDMEVVPEPNIVTDRIKVFLDDSQWREHIKNPLLKQIKRQISLNI